MSEHTAGPWTLTHVAGQNFAVQEFQIRGMFGDHSNIRPIFNKDRYALDGASVYCSPEDAKLIAAAPDLLAAAQDALIALEAAPDTATTRIAKQKLKSAIESATS